MHVLKSKCTALASVKTFVLKKTQEQEDTRVTNGAEFHPLTSNPLPRRLIHPCHNDIDQFRRTESSWPPHFLMPSPWQLNSNMNFEKGG